MASKPLPTISFHSILDAWFSTFTFWLPAVRDGGNGFMSARHKDPNPRALQEVKTHYRGLEQDAKDGKQDSPMPDERSKHSHECILQMNPPGLRSWAMPPRCSSIFILDSRATSHVVGGLSLFSPSFRYTTTTTTATGNAAAAATYQVHDGRVLTVAGVGTISCDNFHIPNVLCVPDLCTGHNLVSVQQLAECDYLVMFGGGQCSVMEQSSGKIVGKGQLHADDGLYHLEFLNISHDKPCEDSTTVRSTSEIRTRTRSSRTSNSS